MIIKDKLFSIFLSHIITFYSLLPSNKDVIRVIKLKNLDYYKYINFNN